MEDMSKPREYCGLCGIMGGEKVMEQVHLGLHSLQHRGQEAAGVMVGMGDKCYLHKATGLVDKVFGSAPKDWRQAKIERAISHVRYSTAGGSTAVNAQPLMVEIAGQQVGIAHNGTICNAPSLRRELQQQGAIFQTSTDTELILHLTSRLLLTPHHGDFLAALEAALQRLEGAFCLLLMTSEYTIAVRDPMGFRPLCIGNFTDGGTIVASESIALTVTGADYLREVAPGEMIIWDRHNRMESRQFAKSERKAFCIFEHVYFARPGSYVFGDSVYEVRKEMGRQMAREAPVDADVVVPIPDSGIYAALGYAEVSGIPFDMCLSRNHYVGRTFIDPGLVSRGNLVRRKLQPIAEALRGKRVCLVEDSIVRGSTSRARIKALREVGVKEIHMRVSCPPHRYGCFFGIDFPEKESLLANKVPNDELAQTLHLDSLEYLTQEGMLSCVKAHAPEDYCCACFDGRYPVDPDGLA
jgi:amidophosphoribosyltransferase